MNERETMMMQRIKQTPFNRLGMQISAHQSSESPQGGESLLVTFENLTKSSATELFDDLEAAFKNFLAFLKQWH